ncbi:MAG TPA: hypothetical protein VMY35_11610 [Phycisphaerae bacterium]|nr:hypothetical protein [Phycisphaerae bacterium]
MDTQVADQADGTAQTTGNGAEQGSASSTGQARQEAASAQGQGGSSQESFTIPRENFKAFGYDHHKAVELGIQGQKFAALAQKHGMTPEQLYDFIQQGEDEQAQTAGTGPASQGRGASDEDRMRQLAEEAADKKVQDYRKAESDARENERRQEYARQAKQARQDIRTELLQKLKIKPDDHRAETIGDLAESHLRRAIAKGLESYDGLKGLDLIEEALKHPPKDGEKATALEAAAKAWADLGNEFVSTAAGRQQGLPGSTLAGGAGGAGKPPKDFKGMTAQEKADWLVGQT